MKRISLLSVFAFLATFSFAQNVTFSGQVASIIYNNCTTCHRQGSIAPFTLESYQDVYNNRFGIMSDVQNHIMPPWSPNPSYSHFLNERRLTDDEINTITNWVGNGALEGEVANEPKVPNFTDGSQLTNVDFNSRCSYHTVTTNTDDFEFFSLPSGLSIDADIKQIELVPENRKIVHHIFVFIDSTGEFTDFVNQGTTHIDGNNYISGGNMNMLKLIGGWLPGGSYQTVPDNMGIRVPRNSHYIVQIHYAPGSMGQSDATQLNIKYTTQKGLRNMTMQPLLDNTVNMKDGPLFIPANTVKVFHEEFIVPNDISLVSIVPHEHKIGVREKVYGIDGQTGDTIRLVDDHWDFHWQGMYTFPYLVHLKAGDKIWAEGTYDNTENNKENPNYPPTDIVAGTSTLTEMMQVFFCYLPYQQGDENISLGSINNPVVSNSISNLVSCNVFPNPVTNGNELNLQISPEGIYTVELFALDGKIIGSYKNMDSKNKLTIPVPQLSAGLYLVKMTSAENIITQKFQVQ